MFTVMQNYAVNCLYRSNQLITWSVNGLSVLLCSFFPEKIEAFCLNVMFLKMLEKEKKLTTVTYTLLFIFIVIIVNFFASTG